MNRYSIAQLEAFFWTAQLGNVQKAADRLNVTQPTLSLRLKQLEARMSQPLLERHGRGLRLTRHGHAFLARVRIVLDAYDDLSNLSRTPDIEGALRIGVAEGFAVACMAALIEELRSEFPLLRPEWMIATSAGLEQALADGKLDLAILVDPLGLRDVRLFALGLQSNGWASSTRLMDTTKGTPRDLAQFTVITTPPPTAMYRATLGWFANDKITPDNVCVCSSLNAALQLVAAGLGIGIFPTKVIDAYPLQGVIGIINASPPLESGRVFVADHATSDETRTRALLNAIERTAERLHYF